METIAIQDECAPDAMEQFEQIVLFKIGKPFSEIKKEMILEEDLGDVLIYHWQNYMIQLEPIMQYSIYKLH